MRGPLDKNGAAIGYALSGRGIPDRGCISAILDRGRSRRKIIFLISDGQNAKNNKNSYETVVKELLRYNISVYSLGVGGGFLDRKFTRLQAYAQTPAPTNPPRNCTSKR